MRTLARLFGIGCGLVVIVIAARYGYKTSDNDFDGAIWAFMFGAVTMAGLFGHALAVHTWRHNRAAAAAVFIVSLCALTVSLSNSLGAMAGRGNALAAARMQTAEIVRTARRGLDRAEAERAALKFTPTDAAAVEAARAKAGAATAAKEAECKLRGTRCREKEQAEAAALGELGTAAANKAMTDQAGKLDSEIAALRRQIADAGPVLEANSQGTALALLFQLPDTQAATLSTYQGLAMALVIEFVIVVSLIAAESIPAAPVPVTAAAAVQAIRQDAPAIEPEERPAIEAKPEAPEAPAAGMEPAAPQLPKREHKQLPPPQPVANVAVVLADLLRPSPRGKIAVPDLYAAYREACSGRGLTPLPGREFPAALASVCEQAGLKVEAGPKGFFLIGVKLPQKRKEAAA
jgi:hypothetical protein